MNTDHQNHPANAEPHAPAQIDIAVSRRPSTSSADREVEIFSSKRMKSNRGEKRKRGGEPNITERVDRNGAIRYRVQIRGKVDGKLHSLCQTFRSMRVAKKWRDKKFAEIELYGFPTRQVTGSTVGEVIERRLETHRHLGRTTIANLKNLRGRDIGKKPVSALTMQDFFEVADELLSEDMLPQTVTGYLTLLVATLKWGDRRGERLPAGIAENAMAIMWEDEILAKSEARTRRVSPAELGSILAKIAENPRQKIPVATIIAFAVFSSRRLGEICRLRWDDLRIDGSRILVRQMKHPRKKRTNDVWCALPPEALRIILSMPRVSEFIFPFNPRSVGAAFRRHRNRANVADLRFHDLRHEAITRQFEMEKTAPFVSKISGHASAACLERYEHVEKVGDRFASWVWLEAAIAGDLTLASKPASAIGRSR